MNFRSLFGPPTPAQMEKWRLVRAKGRKNFILKVGVIRFGGTTFVLTTFELLRDRSSCFRLGALDYVFVIVMGLLVWPAAGYFWGLWVWGINESRFTRTIGRQPTHQTWIFQNLISGKS
jgi:hypothetical protein